MSFSRLLTHTMIQQITVPCFLPLSRAAGSDGATRQDHPSQGHGSSPAAFHQMQRCMSDSRDSIVLVPISFSPGFDAELPAVPAPQRVILHPHQLHISNSRELLAYPWWPCVSEKTGNSRIAARSRTVRADSPHCACRLGANKCMQLRAGTASIPDSFAASRAPGLHAQLIYQALR